MTGNRDGGQAFDLNVEQVLEHWTPAHAVREVIANALDEHALSGIESRPEVVKIGGVWHVRDQGRGLEYRHLTQNESDEKRAHGGVVGQFGVGLKDALATFHRNQIVVSIHSRHGDIRLAERAKHGFGDIVTLHAIVDPPTARGMSGTDVELPGLEDEPAAEAMGYFLAYDDDAVVLESTSHGQILDRPAGAPRSVYVRGVRVAEDDQLLFSYNITKLDAKLRKAMNRERSHVGRSAYTDRVKAILLAVEHPQVLTRLVQDMAGYATGATSDEVKWNDVAERVVRRLSESDPDPVFVTAAERWLHTELIRRAEADGKSVFVVPDGLASRLSDPSNESVTTLSRFAEDWNSRVVIDPIDPTKLSASERSVLALTSRVFELAGGVHRPWPVVVSETLHLTPDGRETAHGLWEPTLGRIVINRECLQSRERFVGTLLHEITHAVSGTGDLTHEFEDALTDTLGAVGTNAL